MSPRFRLSTALLATWLLSSVAVSVTGCALFKTAPGTGAATEAERIQELNAIAESANTVLVIAKEVQSVEISLMNQKLIPAEAHLNIQKAFAIFGAESERALKVIKQLSGPTADRLIAQRALAAATSQLITELTANIPVGQNASFRIGLASLRAALAVLQA